MANHLPLLRIIAFTILVIMLILTAYLLVLMLPVIFGIWLADWTKQTEPTIQHDRFMEREYPWHAAEAKIDTVLERILERE